MASLQPIGQPYYPTQGRGVVEYIRDQGNLSPNFSLLKNQQFKSFTFDRKNEKLLVRKLVYLPMSVCVIIIYLLECHPI